MKYAAKLVVQPAIKKDNGFGNAFEQSIKSSKVKKGSNTKSRNKKRKQHKSIARKTTQIEKINKMKVSSTEAVNDSVQTNPVLATVETESEDEYVVNIFFGPKEENTSSAGFTINIEDCDIDGEESALINNTEAEIVQDAPIKNNGNLTSSQPSFRRTFGPAFDRYNTLELKPRIQDASTTRALIVVSPEQSLQPSKPASGNISPTMLPLIGAALLQIAIREFPGPVRQVRKKASSVFTQTTKMRVRLCKIILGNGGANALPVNNHYNNWPRSEIYVDFNETKWERRKKWIINHKGFLLMLFLFILLISGFCYFQIYPALIRLYYSKIVKDLNRIPFKFSDELQKIWSRFCLDTNEYYLQAVENVSSSKRELGKAMATGMKNNDPRLLKQMDRVLNFEQILYDLEWIEGRILECLNTTQSPSDFWIKLQKNETLVYFVRKYAECFNY